MSFPVKISRLYRSGLCLIFLCLAFVGRTAAQVYTSRTAHVHVQSSNKIKNIEADNYQVASVVNFETGEVRFEGLLKSFEFRLGAIDRVFNSERVNVSQYPKFRFEGMLINSKGQNFEKAGRYTTVVEGTLYLWDEKRITSAEGTIISDGKGKLSVQSDFLMRIEEQSMNKLNELIDKKLPEAMNISTATFGVSRDINVSLDADYTRRNW